MFIFDEHEVIVEVLDRLDPFFFLNKQRFLPFLQGDKEKAIPKQTHSRKNIQKEQDRPAQHPNIDATGNKGYDKAEQLSHQIRFSKLKDRKDKDQAEYESEKFSIVFV